MQITDIKRKALKILGITNADISNYKANRKKHVSKKHWKILMLIMKHEVIETEKFYLFNSKIKTTFFLLKPVIERKRK